MVGVTHWHLESPVGALSCGYSPVGCSPPMGVPLWVFLQTLLHPLNQPTVPMLTVLGVTVMVVTCTTMCWDHRSGTPYTATHTPAISIDVLLLDVIVLTNIIYTSEIKAAWDRSEKKRLDLWFLHWCWRAWTLTFQWTISPQHKSLYFDISWDQMLLFFHRIWTFTFYSNKKTCTVYG